jgi:lysophospholipid acyltransferase (LPLAT)-like uncharacterized protein
VSGLSNSKAEAAGQQGTARRRKSSGVVIPHAPYWYQRLGAWLIFALVRAVSATLRYQWIDRSGYFDNGAAEPAIYCVWHNRLALCLVPYFGYVKKRNQTPGMAALVSASKDGGFLAAILECFGVQPVRGSSSRRGPQALLELTSWAERGYDLAITPDGPRGPCYVVQEGVMGLAQVTGLPIMPVSYYLGWKIRPKSWDRFQIPLPFSRCEMLFGKPVRVPRQASDSEREALRQQLESTLREISRD